jgi:hypothetical protein
MTDFGTPGSFPSAPVPPSSGDRTGPPWEQPGAFFSRWIDTAKMILLNPQGGFANVRRSGGLGAPLTYYAVGIAPAVIIGLLFQLLVGGSAMMGGGRGGAAAMGGAMLLVFMLIGLVLVFVMFFIGTGIVHLVLSLLGGARHGYEATFRTFAYAAGSAAPIGMVPFCGGFISAIWTLVCAVMGLANMQETTPVKAAIAIFAPVLLCCVLWFLAWGAMMAMIMGSAATAGAMSQ